MLFEEINKPNSTTAPSLQRGARNSEAQLLYQSRQQKFRTAELNVDNYKDARLDIPVSMIKGGLKAGKTTNSRRVLASRKTLTNHLDEDAKGYQLWMQASAPPSRYPTTLLCSSCGDEGSYKCQRCGLLYCSLSCENTHNETRCTR